MNMDLIGVSAIRTPRTRDEIALRPGDRAIGGGTWLYSERQSGFDTIVDLTTLDWPEIEETDETLTLAATTRLATVHALGSRWPLFAQCTDALLASWKVWNVATIGGNLCFGVPASAMVSLCAALDATLVIWGTDPTDAAGATTRREHITDFVLGPQRNTLRAGEIVRAIEFPKAALAQRTAFRKIALAKLGRSGAVVIGRRDADGTIALSVTGATSHPWLFRMEGGFSATAALGSVDDRLDTVDDWYDDAHGSPDWREGVTRVLAREVLAELAEPAEPGEPGEPDGRGEPDQSGERA